VSMSSLMTLWMSMKEVHKLLYGGNRNINDITNNLRINLNDVPLNWSLKDDPKVLILNHLQISIELSHQPGINYASTFIQIAPMIVHDDLSNEI